MVGATADAADAAPESAAAEATDAGIDGALDATLDSPVGPGIDGATDAAEDAMNDGSSLDAGEDAAGDASDGSAPTTASVLLSTQGASCLACANDTDAGDCLSQSNCEMFAGDPAAVQSCYDTLACDLRTNCAVDDIIDCYCGTASTGDCAHIADAGNGVCLAQWQAGLGTNNPLTVFTTYDDPSSGAGMANVLVECLLAYSCNDCFQTH